MARRAILAVTLVFVVALAAGTVLDATTNGFAPRTVISLGVIVLLFVGIVGALTQPPRG